MLAKVWAGTLKLLDYMIKSYHRYVKNTTSLQLQAQTLLGERSIQMAASKVREEEFELERTALRAKIRNLEAEIESNSVSKRSMERENIQLRTIINVYITSSELNDPVWDIMNEDTGQSGQSADASSLVGDFKLNGSVDAGRQQLRTLSRLEIEMNEVLSNVLKEDERQRLLLEDLYSLLQKNQEIFGLGAMVKGKWMPGNTDVVEKADSCIQVDEKDDFGVVPIDTTDTPRDDVHGPAPMVTTSNKIRGIGLPYQLRKLMSSFPHVLRIPPAAWVCQIIMSIYFNKIFVDEQRTLKGIPKQSLAEHVYAYFLKTLGIEAVADVQTAQLLKACEHYMGSIRRVSLFASQMGIYDKEAPPSMDVRDTDFILSVLQSLIAQGELVPDKASRRKMSKTAVQIKPEVLRTSAINTVQTIFEKWLPDGGQDYVLKIKTMISADRGQKYCDVDELIEMLIEPWHTVRLTWEEHVYYMFQQHCTVHRVLSEAQFGNDVGARDKDTILSQVAKAAASDCMRRSVRLFQRKEVEKAPSDSDLGTSSGVARKTPVVGGAVVGNPNKEPVCEIMSRKIFIITISLMNPTLSTQQVT